MHEHLNAQKAITKEVYKIMQINSWRQTIHLMNICLMKWFGHLIRLSDNMLV